MLRPGTLAIPLVIALSGVASAQGAPVAERPKPAQLPADSMELGRKFTQWLYTGQKDSLVAHMDSASKAQPGVANMYAQDALTIAARAGTEKRVLEEKFITRNGMRQYWRVAEFTDMSEPLLVRFVINAKGELIGRGLGPKSQAPPIDP